jgi:aspartate-semialdehyde dehydrogenase
VPPAREPRVAVVGATGAVGNQLVELLETRAFPKGELRLFATATETTSTIEIEDAEFEVEEFSDPEDLRGFDLAFLAVPERAANEVIAARPGPLLIDLSGAMRMPSGQPIVSPGITGRERINELRGRMVFETPHPAAHSLATILRALGIENGFAAATLLMGASASGRDRITKTAEESADLLSGSLDLEEDDYQRAFNILSSDANRHLSEVVRAQCAALMGNAPTLALAVLTAPILHGSVLSLQLPPSEQAASYGDRLRAAPGILFVEDNRPIGVIDALGQEAVIAKLERQPGGTTLFAAFDNARLAALIAIWIAENLLLTSH